MKKFFNTRSAKKTAGRIFSFGAGVTAVTLAIGTLEIIFTGRSSVFRGGTLDAVIKTTLVTTAVGSSAAGLISKYDHNDYLQDQLDDLGELTDAQTSLITNVVYSFRDIEMMSPYERAKVIDKMSSVTMLYWLQYDRGEKFFNKGITNHDVAVLKAMSTELTYLVDQAHAGKIDSAEKFIWPDTTAEEKVVN